MSKPAQIFNQTYTIADLQTYPGFGDALFLVVSHAFANTPMVQLWASDVDGKNLIPGQPAHFIDPNTVLVQPPDMVGPWDVVVVG